MCVSDTVINTAAAYKAVIHTDPFGGYFAEVPELPACYIHGDTLDVVYRNFHDAVACHLDMDVGQGRINLLEMAT